MAECSGNHRGAKLDSHRQNKKKYTKALTRQARSCRACHGSNFYGEHCEQRYQEGTSKFLVGGVENCAAALSVTTSLVLRETSEN